MPTAQQQIRSGERFAFGANWTEFLKHLDEDRIAIAEQSLKDLLQVERLDGLRFVDVGSGSGLFSLCARRLGATVHSFDYDPQSVACTQELKDRYFTNDLEWTIAAGSALDEHYLRSIGEFDVVYSWGVLHHTGAMWNAIENVYKLCAPGGKVVIAIYNDQGLRSKLWLLVKKIYCSSSLGMGLITAIFFPWFFLRTCLVSLIRRQNEFTRYRRHRGMSIVHDWRDWLGGLPFETASPPEIQIFFEARGFELMYVKKTRRLGCNEFVFHRR